MLEVLLAYGKLGAAVIILVLFGAYLFAEPGKEISFFGLRFHKRRFRSDRLKKYKRLPRVIPSEWDAVLRAFAHLDTNILHRDRIFEYTSAFRGMTEMQTRQTCNQMAEKGLIEYSRNCYLATSRALPLISKIQTEASREA